MALYSISSLLKRAVTINPAQLFITVWRELIDLKNWCTPRKTQPCQVFRKILMVTGTNLMLHCRWQPAKESCSLVKAPNQPLFYSSASMAVKCRLMLAKQQVRSRKATETSAQLHKQDCRACLKRLRYLLFNGKMRRNETLFVQKS